MGFSTVGGRAGLQARVQGLDEMDFGPRLCCSEHSPSLCRECYSGSTAALDFLTLWAQGASQPLVSTLNASDAAITSNMAIVPTSNGQISAFVPQSSQLVVDISGYFAP